MLQSKMSHYFIEVQGEGFPLILLHGFTGDASTWTTLVQRLRGKRKLVLY